MISIGQIIDQSWHIYKNNFGPFISVAGWLLISAAINVVALSLHAPASSLLTERALTTSENIGAVLLLLNNFIITPLIGIWVVAVLVRLIKAVSDKKRSTLKMITKEGTKLFWPLVIVSLLYSLVLFATLLFLVPGFFFLFAGAGISLVGGTISMIGTLLLIIGIVLATIFIFIWGVRFFLSSFALLVDNFRGRDALRESYRLVQGRFWEVFFRLLIPKLLFLLLFGIILYVFINIGNVFAAGVSGLNIDLHVRLNTIVTSSLIAIITILVNPLIYIADYLIYKDLRS